MTIRTAGDALSEDVVRVTGESHLSELKSHARGHRAIHVAVFDGDSLAGLIALPEIASAHPSRIFFDLLPKEPTSIVSANVSLAETAMLLRQSPLRAVAVVDDQQRFLGVVTQESLLAALLKQARECSEVKFRVLLEATPDAMLIVDQRGVITFANHGVEHVFGFRANELLEKPIERLVPGWLQNARFEEPVSLTALPQDRRAQRHWECLGVHKDGYEFPAEVSLSPLRTDEGLQVIAAIRDVSERKRTEVELCIAEEAIASAITPICFCDVDRRITRVNRAFCDLFGLTNEQAVVGQDRWFSFHPISADEIYDRVLTQGSWTGEVTSAKVDGSALELYVCAQVVRNAAGSPLCTMATFLDITERKRNENLLRMHERALASVSNGILITDPRQHDNPIIYCNPAVTHITGYQEEEVIGRNCRFLQGADRDQPELEEVRRAIAERRDCRVVLRNYRKDGRLFWNELTISPVFNAAGELENFVGIQNDITDRKEAELQRDALRSQLAHVSRVSNLGTIATSLAHELNQPLSAIIHYLEACDSLLDRPVEPRLREAIQEAKELAFQAAGIVNHLRAYAKRREPQPTDVDVNHLIVDVLKVLEADARQRGVRLRSLLAQEMPTVLADPVLIQQVLLNLVLNAMEASEEVAGQRRQVVIHTATSPYNDDIEVSVCDNGRGLTPEELRHIFEPFYTTKREGLGMGLAISRDIIEAHGGRIWGESNPMGGAVFRFTLPTTERKYPA